MAYFDNSDIATPTDKDLNGRVEPTAKYDDTFIISTSDGEDMIHEFSIVHDRIDLSAFDLEFAEVKSLMKDKGWATEIDLSGQQGGSAGDKLMLKSIDLDQLDETNFIL